MPSDSFNRTDVDPLAGNWTAQNGSHKIVSNQVAQSGDNVNVSYWNADAAPDDQFSEVALATAGDGGGPAGRCSTSAFTCYLIFAAGGSRIFKKIVAGTGTDLGGSSPGNSANDVMRIECEGSTIRCKRNGTEVTGSPITDTSIASGRWGIFVDNNGSTRLDDWQGGSLAVAGDAVPVCWQQYRQRRA